MVCIRTNGDVLTADGSSNGVFHKENGLVYILTINNDQMAGKA